jgi:hypothetical protein
MEWSEDKGLGGGYTLNLGRGLKVTVHYAISGEKGFIVNVNRQTLEKRYSSVEKAKEAGEKALKQVLDEWNTKFSDFKKSKEKG